MSTSSSDEVDEVQCPDCFGDGWGEHPNGTNACPRCNGTGKLRVTAPSSSDEVDEVQP